MTRKLAAEALGSFFLLAAIIGAGIMAAGIAPGDGGALLIGSTLAIGAILVVIITLFGPVSGAHFNPAVTLVFLARGEITRGEAAAYISVQVMAAITGTIAANIMFGLDPVHIATVDRTGSHMWVSEFVATFGLLITVLGGIRVKPDLVPALVGLYITAGIWFTASTSFANPAVSVGRMFSATPAGLAPDGLLPFLICQLLGAFAAHFVAQFLWPEGEG